MKLTEVGTLLAFASAFDNRKPDPAIAVAWHALLADVDYDDAKHVVILFQTEKEPNQYLDVGWIVKRVDVLNRATRKLIETDVRAARARGLIDREWPESSPLPADVADRLARARAIDANTAEQYATMEITDGVPVELPTMKSPDDV